MTRQSGMTLVEVLIAMLIVLAVTAGSLAFVARGRNAQRTGESIARLEETLDAGFVILTDEIRAAGYLGLAPPASAVAGATPVGTVEPADLMVAGVCGASLAHDLAKPVVAVDGAYGAAPGIPIGCRAGPDGRIQVRSDTLILRRAGTETVRPTPGRLQIESNLRAAALHADGVARLGPAARWSDLEVGVYYVSADSTGLRGFPSLRRKRLVGGTRPAFQDEELVSGICDLQIELGVDDAADADPAVDRWIAPDAPLINAYLRAIRIELEAESDVAGVSLQGNSRRRRVSRVVELRNRGAGA
jgi:prepilin-type N-terminal cleavage/methylation domain-containing protein